MILHLRISGAMLIVLGLAHATFGRRLNWKSDLAKLTLINRQIFHVHCFYIGMLLVMSGALSLFFAGDLLTPQPLTRAILAGLSLIWAIRLYIQWFVFDRSLWRDDSFNRAVHYLLTVFWVYVTTVDALAFWRVLQSE